MTHAGRRGVKALRWSADGNETPRNFLLASGDATGLVAFWTVDRRARPEKIAELSPERALSFGEFLSAKAAGESGAFRVTHLLAAPFDAKTDADGEKNAPGSNLSSFRFLVGYARFGTGGSAMCAVDIRHVPHPDTEIVPEGPKSLRPKPITVASAVLFQSEAPFAAALLRRSRGTDSESMPATFAAVTLDLNSTLRCHAPPSPDWRAEDYQTKSKGSTGLTSKEGCWTETLAFKLPVEGVTSEGLVWAREGVLAAVSDKDPSGAVRMFDLESGANYSLRAWDSEHVSGGDKTRLVTSQDSSRDFASRRLTCVARDDATGGLAVGSRDGRVAVFRRVGGFDEDERRRTGTTRDTDKQTTKSSDASRRAGSSRRSRRRGDDGRGDVGRVGGDVGGSERRFFREDVVERRRPRRTRVAPLGDDTARVLVRDESCRGAALRLEVVARPERARRGRLGRRLFEIANRARQTKTRRRRLRFRRRRRRRKRTAVWEKLIVSLRARLGPRAFGGQGSRRREFSAPRRRRVNSGERGGFVSAARVSVWEKRERADSRRRRIWRLFAHLDQQTRRVTRVWSGRVRTRRALPAPPAERRW